MGRKKHPHGKAGTLIEVKVIKGRPYWYERTRVYLDAGKSCIKSKYLGPGPERTPESAAAELHESAKATVRTNHRSKRKALPTKSTGSGIARKIPPVDLWTTHLKIFYQAPAEIGSAQLTAAYSRSSKRYRRGVRPVFHGEWLGHVGGGKNKGPQPEISASRWRTN
jgi:hypothetical protein